MRALQRFTTIEVSESGLSPTLSLRKTNDSRFFQSWKYHGILGNMENEKKPGKIEIFSYCQYTFQFLKSGATCMLNSCALEDFIL